jgi:hypothetical protein
MNEGNAQIAILTRLLDHRTDRRFQKVLDGSSGQRLPSAHTDEDCHSIRILALFLLRPARFPL